MSNEENLELIRKYRLGNEKILEEIVSRNMGLVNMVVGKILKVARIYSFTVDDLSQEGIIGLIKAVNSYDIEAKNNFSTYAYKAIKNNILWALSVNDSIVRLPVNMIYKLRELYDKKRKLELLGEDVSIMRLALEDGVNLRNFKDALLFWGDLISLDDAFSGEFSFAQYKNVVAGSDDVVEEVLKREERELAILLMDYLTERQKEIVRLYYGIGMDRSYSDREIAMMLGVTRSNIGNILKAALKRMKKISSEDKRILQRIK